MIGHTYVFLSLGIRFDMTNAYILASVAGFSLHLFSTRTMERAFPDTKQRAVYA